MKPTLRMGEAPRLTGSTLIDLDCQFPSVASHVLEGSGGGYGPGIVLLLKNRIAG
jgi:hypothetical protein